MTKYTIEVKEINTITFEVEAENTVKAVENVRAMYISNHYDESMRDTEVQFDVVAKTTL